MENILKQQGVVYLPLSSDTESAYILQRIIGMLSTYGAVEIKTTENSISFKGGNTPFKSNVNPLMGVSSGDLELIKNKDSYNIKYKLVLMHLLFWSIVNMVALALFVLFSSSEVHIQTVLSSITAGIIGFGFTFAGYYGFTSVRFSKVIQKAVANE